MKKLFLGLFILFILVFGILFIAAKFFAEPQLKALIEEKGSELISGVVTVQNVHIVFWPPLSIALDDVTVTREKVKPQVHLKVPSTNLSLDFTELFLRKLVTHVIMEEPQVEVVIPEKTTPASALKKAAAPSGSQRDIDLPFGVSPSLDLKINKGKISILRGKEKEELSALDIKFTAPTLNAPWTLDLTTLVHFTDPADFSFPVNIHSLFIASPESVQTQNTEIEIAGIKIDLKGKSIFETEDHQWDGVVDIPELDKVLIPPQLSPVLKTWFGTIKGHAHLEHKPNSSWLADGVLESQNIKSSLDLRDPRNFNRMNVQGDFTSGHGIIDFKYDKSFIISKLKADGDLTNLSLTSPQFDKKSGTPLLFSIDGSGNQKAFNVSQAQVILAKFLVQVQGQFALEAETSSDLRITVPTTALDGMEKLFPLLSSTPLTGRVELRAHVSGDFKNYKNLNINLNPLSFENLRGAIQWESADKSKLISGPVATNGKINLDAQGQNLISGVVNMKADLTDLNIAMGNQFQKKAATPLRLNLQATQKGKALLITQGEVTTTAGVFNLKGSLKNPQNPDLNLILTVPNLNLKTLSAFIPLLEPWRLSGFAQGKFFLNGVYDLKNGIEKSPLNLKGNISAQIPNFTYVSKKKKVEPLQSGFQKSTVVREGYLPPWPIMKNLKLDSDIKIANLEIDEIKLSQVQSKMEIASGFVHGNLDILHIFSGSLNVSGIETSLLTPEATLSCKVNFKQISVQEALTQVAPTWKDTLKGLAFGQVRIHKAADINAEGSVEIKNGFLSTTSFDQYINEKLSQVPGLGSREPVNTKGSAMDIKSQFNLNSGDLKVIDLNALTPERNEMDIAGTIKADKTLDLSGKVWLANAPVGGDFAKCNMDKSGRLVIPLHVSGTATKPQYNLAEGTLQSMISNLATCQVDKLKSQMKDQLQNEAKKQLQNILGN